MTTHNSSSLFANKRQKKLPSDQNLPNTVIKKYMYCITFDIILTRGGWLMFVDSRNFAGS